MGSFLHSRNREGGSGCSVWLLLSPGSSSSPCWRQSPAPCSRNTWGAPLRLARSRQGKAVSQTSPSEMRLWHTPNVSAQLPKQTRAVSVEGRIFYRAERVLPSQCQKGSLLLWLSTANEANGKALTKDLPGLCSGPVLGSASRPWTHADGVSSPGIRAELCHGALEKGNPDSYGCS